MSSKKCIYIKLFDTTKINLPEGFSRINARKMLKNGQFMSNIG